ncbi:hypothetical protein TRIUR3_28371 [Triticum urartu]|uniref:Uncharacterized protein n=1 Tax=Triticum urartu TaxID=4572 RepID=M8A753_TRIUA|nr:hypothetical protein TRIUR3_28371 [Triticum urartu]
MALPSDLTTGDEQGLSGTPRRPVRRGGRGGRRRAGQRRGWRWRSGTGKVGKEVGAPEPAWRWEAGLRSVMGRSGGRRGGRQGGAGGVGGYQNKEVLLSE